MAKIAIVILNYNGKSFLEQFLPSVIRCSKGSEIIVADNASVDESATLINQKFKEIKFLPLERNFGYAGGYNRALAQIKATYYVLLNSDVQVTENWLTPMTHFLDTHPRYAGCQPKILDFNNKTYFEYAGGAGGFIDKLGYPYCRGRIFDSIERDEGQYNTEKDVFWTSGACMMIRSKVFHDLDGFDNDFFAHMEEIDFCWRVAISNMSLSCIPTSVVYHIGGGTLNKANSLKTKLNFRNGFNLLIKNLPLKSLLWTIPIRLSLDWLAVFRFALNGSFRHSIAIIKAHLEIVSAFKKTWRKRRNTNSIKRSPFSIVVSYYLRGKKKYCHL